MCTSFEAVHRALQRLYAAACARTDAQAEQREATERVRQAVIAARATGVSVRRVADVCQISIGSVTRWTGAASAADPTAASVKR